MYFPARSFHAGSQLGATGQLVLGCWLAAAEMGRPTQTTDAYSSAYRSAIVRWADSGFSAYQYAYQRSCLCVPYWTRPVVIDVTDNRIGRIADEELGITASDVRSQP